MNDTIDDRLDSIMVRVEAAAFDAWWRGQFGNRQL